MKNLTIILLLLLTARAVSAQPKWENCTSADFSKAIMAVEELVMDKSSYSYETNYLFFEQIESVKPIIEDQARLICLKGEEWYIEQFGKVIVQDRSVQLEVDPTYKSIIIRDASKDYTTRKTTADFAALDMPGASIKMRTVGNSKRYYVDFPDGQQYIAAEITLGGTMGIEKYVLYSKPTTLESDNGTVFSAQPRMEVTYKNFQQGNSVKTDSMKRTSHFVTVKEGEYALNNDYKEYELIDLRSQP